MIINQGYEIQMEYNETLRKHFQSDLLQLDMLKAKEAAQMINEWVADQTEQKIQNLVSPALFTSHTQMLLINTVYLKADWQSPFLKAYTSLKPFYLTDGSCVQVDTMQKIGTLKLQKVPGARALEMPYMGGNISMTIILPDHGEPLSAVEANLTPALLQHIITNDQSEYIRVNLQLPKFKIQFGDSVRKILI